MLTTQVKPSSFANPVVAGSLKNFPGSGMEGILLKLIGKIGNLKHFPGSGTEGILGRRVYGHGNEFFQTSRVNSFGEWPLNLSELYLATPLKTYPENFEEYRYRSFSTASYFALFDNFSFTMGPCSGLSHTMSSPGELFFASRYRASVWIRKSSFNLYPLKTPGSPWTAG